MKLKTDKILFRTFPHTHHGYSRQSRSEGWGRRGPKELKDRDDLSGCEDESSYPAGLLTRLQDAAKKCPSVLLDADIMDGQPCIAGTRIPVRAVLRVIEHYGSLDEAVRCYPQLTTEHVKDALYFSQLVLELPSGLDEDTLIA